MTNLNLPNFQKIMDSIQDIESSFDNQTIPIKDRIKKETNDIIKNRNLSDIEIFVIFAGNLLMRFTKGDVSPAILETLGMGLSSMDDIKEDKLNQIIPKIRGYRFKNSAAQILLDAKKIFREYYNSDWNKYFLDAEKNSKNNFLDDPFLKIKNVSYKVRDLALSCFSKHFIAVDMQIAKILKRTGLICYSYKFNLEVGTDLTNKYEYLNLRKLLYNLSKKSTYSLLEIDRSFWHFGRVVCKSKPKCNLCPIEGCLSQKT